MAAMSLQGIGLEPSGRVTASRSTGGATRLGSMPVGDTMTPTGMAVELGISPKTLRAWLRAKRASGDRRLFDHAHGAPWTFDGGLAYDLIRQYRAEKQGGRDDVVRGPHAWLNWRAQADGRPKRTSAKTSTSSVLPSWQEHPLYSDADIVGQLELGPYRFIITMPEHRIEVGRVAMQVVVRVDDHLPEPDYGMAWDEEDVSLYFGGDLADELAALLSLALGRRMRSGGVTRQAFSANSFGTPIEGMHHPPVLIAPRGGAMLPGITRSASLDDAGPYLETYPGLATEDAVALVRAASQYADALWIADADPRLAWIRLISALETAANRWDAAKDETPVQQLMRHRRKVYNAIKDCPTDVIEKVARDLAGTFKATKKFKDFAVAFDPGPPAVRPENATFNWGDLDTALDILYSYRSADLHAGIAFPGPLCEPPPGRADPPFEIFPALGASGRGGQWLAEGLPMYLHLFAYITGGALRRWWMSLASAAPSASDST